MEVVTFQSAHETLQVQMDQDKSLHVLINQVRRREVLLRILLFVDATLTPVSLVAAHGFDIHKLASSRALCPAYSLLDWLIISWLRDLFMWVSLCKGRRVIPNLADVIPNVAEPNRHVRAARRTAVVVFLSGFARLCLLDWQDKVPPRTCVPTFIVSTIMAPLLALVTHVLLQSHKRLVEEHVRISAYNYDVESSDAPQYSSQLSFFETFKLMKPYFWPSTGEAMEVALNRACAISTWVCVAASKAVHLISPIFLARATNAFEAQLESGKGGPVSQTVVMNLIWYAFFIFLSKALKELQSVIYIRVQQAAYVEIAEHTFAHLHSLSLDWHLRKKTGNVVRSLDRGIESAQQIMQYVFLYLFPTLGESIAMGLIFILRFNNTRLAIFMLLNLCGYCYLTVKVTIWRKSFRTAMSEHDNDMHDRLTDSLINCETVKYFTAEDYECQQYRGDVQKFQRMSMATKASLSLLNATQQWVINFTLAGSMMIACANLLEDGGSLGDFVAVNAYIVQVFAPLNFLGTIYSMAINAVVDMKNFGQLLAETSEVRDAVDAKALDLDTQKKCPMIEFRNVSFHYRRQPHARSIKDVSFSIQRGGTLALVGTTGAGKTTITRLLFRFYDPVSGEVFVNGQDARSVTQKSLRQAMGCVPQDVVMFNATLAHNIQYGDIDNCSEEAMEEAVKQAQLADLVEQQADGYQTIIGERGLKLSGGEKQRLAIARCLVKNPPIVVLDEATSALDSQTEQKLQHALDFLSTSRTVLAIAHRLSTVRNSKEILVMDEGKVVERGTHDELLTRGQKYSSMWNHQWFGSDETTSNGSSNKSWAENERPTQTKSVVEKVGGSVCPITGEVGSCPFAAKKSARSV
jgi:ABC-type transport system involved in Fe-S cluster assembly fused permease/ATPase subunit